jgi:hypothetical protein
MSSRISSSNLFLNWALAAYLERSLPEIKEVKKLLKKKFVNENGRKMNESDDKENILCVRRGCRRQVAVQVSCGSKVFQLIWELVEHEDGAVEFWVYPLSNSNHFTRRGILIKKTWACPRNEAQTCAKCGQVIPVYLYFFHAQKDTMRWFCKVQYHLLNFFGRYLHANRQPC